MTRQDDVMEPSVTWSRVAARTAVAAVVAAVVATVWLTLSPTTYVSSTSIYVKSGGNDAAAVQQRGLYDQNRAQTYATLARGDLVLAEARRASGLDLTTDELARELSVQVLPQTVVLVVTVEDPSAADAQRLSDAVAATLVTQANRIEREGSQGTAPVELEVVDPAVRADHPASPDRVRIAVFSLLLAAVVALVLPLRRPRRPAAIAASTTAPRTA